MLDNMTTEEMQEAIRIIDGRAETECSGNVTKENIASDGVEVDYISSGALTHSSPILDISMKNLHPVRGWDDEGSDRRKKTGVSRIQKRMACARKILRR